ncbi:MAG: glucose-1-phosphate adenylyltransferase subunit GlgD [Clostridiales Family XIII bacterium]|jgi:glucose-1-phosphate adenylyltransferase|nr:glucose-1-phosphate adenylyltransferase subunit GlgD [Clostridiales Family XIII bacterium]
MIRDAFGLIYAGEQIINLRELVESRAVGALPIAGRYRVIDFALSNMVNSGIRTVAIAANRNYNSLMDHLASGKSWDLSRKSDGLFLLTPYANRDNQGISRGMIDALKNSLGFIRRSKEQYCILTGSYTVFNRTYDDMMKSHVESGADITILYNRMAADHSGGDGDRFEDVRIKLAKNGVVTNIEINPGLSSLGCMSMDVYIIRKEVLIYLVEECFAKGEHHFVDNLLRGNLDRLKIMGFEHTGYVGRMHSVAAYYKANMDLLDADLQRSLFRSRNRIYTKVKDEVPAKYICDSKVSNSIVANGCIIEGEVRNSVIFRGVYIGKGTVVKNSIVLPNVEINDNAELENVILDKDVSVRNRSRLIGNPAFPVVIRKGAMV